LAVKGQLNIL